jgi:hypothetical protein
MDRFHLNTFFIFRLDFLFFSFYAISKVFLGIFFIYIEMLMRVQRRLIELSIYYKWYLIFFFGVEKIVFNVYIFLVFFMVINYFCIAYHFFFLFFAYKYFSYMAVNVFKPYVIKIFLKNYYIDISFIYIKF